MYWYHAIHHQLCILHQFRKQDYSLLQLFLSEKKKTEQLYYNLCYEAHLQVVN